jgi:uncharacterized damage-inducible protein DinB
MTNRLTALIFILLTSIAPVQAADDIVGPLRTQWGVTRDLVLNLAEIIPEAKYDYKPVPEVRSFREVLVHVALANLNYMSTAAGTPAPDRAKIEAMKTRDEILKALRDSYVFGDQTLAALTDEKAVEKITFRGQTVVRWYPVLFSIQDNMDHYGNLVVYIRLNGMVPPRTAAARKAKPQ